MRWLWALAGCGPSSYGAEPYLVLRGVVDPAVQVDGDDAVLRGLWAVAAGGELCTEVQPLEILPYVTSFEVPIPGPPSAEAREACVPAPETLGPGPSGFGVLVLVDPAGDEPTVTASPPQLLEWFAGEPVSLSELVVVQGGRLAGVVDQQVLMVHHGELAFGPEWCRFDAALPGLTVYEDAGTGCGGWTPVDPAGVRTELQGIVLGPPP